MKFNQFFLFLITFFLVNSCQLGDKMNRYQKGMEDSKKIESFLSETKSSLKFDVFYTDHNKRKVVVSYNYYDSYNEFPKDVIALQQFLSIKNIEYGYVVAINEQGSQMIFDQMAFKNHKKCVETVLNFSKSVRDSNREEILKFLDKTTLNDKNVMELVQFLGPITSTEIIHYRPESSSLLGARSEVFMVCLNHDHVISMTLNHENTKLIKSCNLIGNNCIVPQPKLSSSDDIIDIRTIN